MFTGMAKKYLAPPAAPPPAPRPAPSSGGSKGWGMPRNISQAVNRSKSQSRPLSVTKARGQGAGLAAFGGLLDQAIEGPPNRSEGYEFVKDWLDEVLGPGGYTTTSTTGGQHNPGSLHPEGEGLDVVTPDMNRDWARLRADPRFALMQEAMHEHVGDTPMTTGEHFHFGYTGGKPLVKGGFNVDKFKGLMPGVEINPQVAKQIGEQRLASRGAPTQQGSSNTLQNWTPGTPLSQDQIYTLARQRGLDDATARTASAIAMAESSGNPLSNLVSDVEDSRGLWQINTYAHPQWANKDLTDPNTAFDAMMEVSGGGKNWGPWSVYTSGKYQKFLNNPLTGSAPVPSGGVGSPGVSASSRSSSQGSTGSSSRASASSPGTNPAQTSLMQLLAAPSSPLSASQGIQGYLSQLLSPQNTMPQMISTLRQEGIPENRIEELVAYLMGEDEE